MVPGVIIFRNSALQPIYSKLDLPRRELKPANADATLSSRNSLIRSKLKYIAIIGDPPTKKNILKLVTSQRGAVGFIFGK